MTYKSRKTASQQLTGLGFVVGLHLVGIYVVASGLAHQAVQSVMAPIETKVIEDAKPKAEELPPPPPKLQTPPPYVPPPDLDVAIEAPPPTAAPTTAISSVSNTKPVAAPPPATVPDTEAKLDPRNRRNQITESDYPTASIRLREEGAPVLSILVLEDGSVGDAKLLQTCGNPRLDEAALKLVKRFRYAPAIKDGKPVSLWKTQTITFKLTDR